MDLRLGFNSGFPQVPQRQGIPQRVIRCSFEECQNCSRASALCNRHYDLLLYQRPDLKEKHNLSGRERERLMREAIIKALGGRWCANPFGDHEKPFYFEYVHLDHRNGDGARWRKRLGPGSHEIRYFSKHLDETRKVLQVLCPNCNEKKKHLGGEIPGYRLDEAIARPPGSDWSPPIEPTEKPKSN